jgi:hypothetical protein
MSDTDILRDIITDHKLCYVQKNELEKAIEKLTSKKIDVSEDGEKSCPVCDCEILGYYAEYCEHCGQSLDRSDEDE